MKRNILFTLILLGVLIIGLFVVSYGKVEGYTNNNNCCCIYNYYEKNNDYKANFQQFLKDGILPNVDYYIVINGNSTVDIPNKENIKVYIRENKGYDFGAYSHVLPKIEKKYDKYFFINTSVSGPHLKQGNDWTQPFLDLFNSQNVKLVGTTINIYDKPTFDNHDLEKIYEKKGPFTHVQSMVFCMDREYLEYLQSIDFFNEQKMNDMNNINDVIAHKEIGLSQQAIKKGWNINCLLPKYQGLDYLTIDKPIDTTTKETDPYYPNNYFGTTIDKYDVIFYKEYRLMSILT